MSKVFERYHAVMNLLPIEPRYMTVKELMSALSQKTINTELRTLQRTLSDIKDVMDSDGHYELLCKNMPIKRGKPEKGWAWKRQTGRPLFSPSELDPPRALTLQLSAELLQVILPEEYLADVKKTITKKANELLSRASVGKIPQKVKVLPRGKGRLPAAVDTKLLNSILDAVLDEQQIQVNYAPVSREDGSDRQYKLNPLGLIFRFDTFYLVHTLEDRDNNKHKHSIMEWPLQRFRSVTRLTTKIRSPVDFDLDAHLQAPGFTQNQANELRQLKTSVNLRLLFNKTTARYVVERPFGENQTIKPQDDGRVLVTATVILNRDVISELFNFADDVEILAPKPLRKYFANISKRLYAQYHPN